MHFLITKYILKLEGICSSVVSISITGHIQIQVFLAIECNLT